MEARERVYNIKGDLEGEEHIVLNLSPDRDSRVRVALVSAEENGRNIASHIRAEVEGGSALGPSPFRPTEGQHVEAWRNGETRIIDGRVCVGFAFSFETGEYSLEGVAWLDKEYGLPLEAHAEVVSVPFMEEGVRITAYTEVQEYTLTETGDCLLERTRIDMGIAVPGFEGQVRTFNLARKHWRYTPDSH